MSDSSRQRHRAMGSICHHHHWKGVGHAIENNDRRARHKQFKERDSIISVPSKSRTRTYRLNSRPGNVPNTRSISAARRREVSSSRSKEEVEMSLSRSCSPSEDKRRRRESCRLVRECKVESRGVCSVGSMEGSGFWLCEIERRARVVRRETRWPRGPQPGLSRSSCRRGTEMEEEAELEREAAGSSPGRVR